MAAPICLWRHREAFAVRVSLGLPIAVGGLLATGCRETPKAASRPPEPVQVTQVIQLYSIDHLPREGKVRRGQPIPRSLHLNVKRMRVSGSTGALPTSGNEPQAGRSRPTAHRHGTRRGPDVEHGSKADSSMTSPAVPSR